MRFFYLLFVCTLSLPGFSQLTWSYVDSLYQPLPASIRVQMGKGLIDGKLVIAYCVLATLDERNLTFTTQIGGGKRFTPKQYFEMEDSPLVVVNGTFFSFADNRNLNVVIKDNLLEAYNVPAVRKPRDSAFYYITRSAIGISKSRKAHVDWIYTDSATRLAYALRRGPSTAEGNKPNPSWKEVKKGVPGVFFKRKKWRMQTAIGGGPVLIRRGKIAITSQAERMFVNGEADRHPRTAMGYTRQGQLIILTVAGRSPGISDGVTLRQEANLLLELGCYEALNLDGGGSSCLLINGKETIRPSDKEGQRPVPAVFLIKSTIR